MATLKSVIWAWPIASRRMLSGFKSLHVEAPQMSMTRAHRVDLPMDYFLTVKVGQC